MVGAWRARALLAVCLAATWPGLAQSPDARKLCWKKGSWQEFQLAGKPWGLTWTNPTCIDVCPAAEGLDGSYASSVLLRGRVRTKLDRGVMADPPDCVYPVTQLQDGPGAGLYRSRGTSRQTCTASGEPHLMNADQSSANGAAWACTSRPECVDDPLCACCSDEMCPYDAVFTTQRLRQFQVWWDFTTSNDACHYPDPDQSSPRPPAKVITPIPLFTEGVHVGTSPGSSSICSWIVRCHPGTTPKLTVTSAYGSPTVSGTEIIPTCSVYAASEGGETCPEPLTSTGDMEVNVPYMASLSATATCEGEPTNILPDLPDDWAPYQWLAWDTANDMLVTPDPATTVPAATSGAACGVQENECWRGMLAPYSVTEHDTNIFIPNDWATANLEGGSNTDQQRYLRRASTVARV